TLHKMIDASSPGHKTWLLENLSTGSTVSVDGFDISLSAYKSLNHGLSEKGIKTVLSEDIISEAWLDRPSLPTSAIFDHAVKYAGASRKQKLDAVVSILNEENADYCLVTALDEIAWVLNIRGADVAFNPVAISYLLIGRNEHTLFMDGRKILA